jgi:nucleoside-triphosphatase THEP1
MEFKKAVKSKCKARVAIYGPSGGGKTFSALRIAKGLGGKIAVIDSERGSASKYADRFEFDSLELEQPNIESMCQAIKAAHGYGVLVVDSLSHAWQELLQEIDKLANAKFKGNTWSAWSEGTPKQRRLIDAILTFPGHVIATMRSKTEWTQEANGNGKSRPVRVGLAPEQGKGIEYEFDILMAITPEHTAHVEKDRSGMFQDQIIDKPDEKFGEKLAAWLSDAPAPDKSEQEAGYIADCLAEIRTADSVAKLDEIGKLLKGKSQRIKDAVRDTFAARKEELKQTQAA